MRPYYDHGGITIYHADCRDVLCSLSADLLLTDPDYGVGMRYGDKCLTAHEADELLRTTLTLGEPRIASGHAVLFWSGSWGRIEAFRSVVASTGWSIRHLGIWYKPNGAGSSGNGLARRFETWFWLDQGRHPRRGEWQHLPDCIALNRVYPGMLEAMLHPSQKPEELLRRLIRFFSLPGQVILDPFMGSGSTLRAAKDLGRRAIGVEICEAYCEIAARRLERECLPMSMEPVEQREASRQLPMLSGMASTTDCNKVGLDVSVLNPVEISDRE